MTVAAVDTYSYKLNIVSSSLKWGNGSVGIWPCSSRIGHNFHQLVDTAVVSDVIEGLTSTIFIFDDDYGRYGRKRENIFLLTSVTSIYFTIIHYNTCGSHRKIKFLIEFEVVATVLTPWNIELILAVRHPTEPKSVVPTVKKLLRAKNQNKS